jgi:cytochrome b561
MHLRNGGHGYGAVTKLLHWLTVLVIGAQFVVGYTMDADGDFQEADCDPPGEGRSGGDTSDAEEAELDRLEDRCEAEQDALEGRSEDGVGTAWSDLGDGSLLDGGLTGPEVHVLLGLTIILLGVVRLVWRSTTPLPPWAEALSERERFVEAWLEKVLLGLLFVVPGTGILLVLGEDDWLPLHVAAHVAFFAALALHVGLVLRHTVVRRDRHLQRML